MSELGVLPLGKLHREIVEQWTLETEGNLDIVVTGKQRQHYIARHPEMAELERHLQETVLDPECVHGNRSDHSVAIFYRRLSDRQFLRVAVLMQATPGLRKHSVMSYRLAAVREVEKNVERCRWKRI
ncbi:MAG TPA: hypothetical protein VNL16_06905 [Chloroflexota bacterium]|nr:hypothetical protein [Chloroflexota bacterium]